MPYIFAAAESLFKDYYKTSFEVSDNFWPNFLDKVSNNFLITYGALLTKSGTANKKKFKDNAYADMFADKLKEMEGLQKYRDKINLYIDSGGYQVQMGYVDFNDIDGFVDTYAHFLEKYKDMYDWAFSLDIVYPKGPHANYDDLYDLNKSSYTKLSQLSEDARKKVLFIYHYKTPETLKLFENIYDEVGEHYISGYWSLSASVAYVSYFVKLPFISSVLGLTWCIADAIKRGFKEVKIHILAGCGLKDIFFYKILERYVEEVHGVHLEVSYDSSAAFKQFLVSRSCSVILDGNVLPKLSLRQDDLNKKCGYKNLTNIEAYELFIKEMVRYVDPSIGEIQLNPFYDEEGKMDKVQQFLGLMHLMYFYRKFDEYCHNLVYGYIKDIRNPDFNQIGNMILKFSSSRSYREFCNKLKKTMVFINNIGDKDLIKRSIMNSNLANCEILYEREEYDKQDLDWE